MRRAEGVYEHEARFIALSVNVYSTELWCNKSNVSDPCACYVVQSSGDKNIQAGK
jgi:hypothetical protein